MIATIRNLAAALAVACAALAATGPSAAQVIESRAESWGLQNEQPAVISGEVVDILCVLAGDCPAQCGGGSRQLGILQKSGTLTLVAKNGQPLFNGAVDDLVPFCRKQVDADGLFAGNDTSKIFQLQFIREAGSKEWVKAERWTKRWTERNPSIAAMVDEWFYHDPRILKQIQAKGYLGLGAAVDAEFIKQQ